MRTMRRKSRQVVLNRETLHQLDAIDLARVAGGVTLGTICCTKVCPTDTCDSRCLC